MRETSYPRRHVRVRPTHPLVLAISMNSSSVLSSSHVCWVSELTEASHVFVFCLWKTLLQPADVLVERLGGFHFRMQILQCARVFVALLIASRPFAFC